MAGAARSTLEGILSITFGAALGSLATILTGAFGYLNKDRELDLKMIEISLTILSGEKTDKSTYARKFAIDSLVKYSGVNISEEDRENWVNYGTVPKGDFFTVAPAGSGNWAPPNIESFTDEDHILALARLLYGEAGGEPRSTKVAVASVVMNRVKSGKYADTVAKVIYQPLQFGVMSRSSDPGWKTIHESLPASSPAFDECLAIAREVYAGSIADNTNNATHYHLKIFRPAWAKTMTVTLTEDNLIFYRM